MRAELKLKKRGVGREKDRGEKGADGYCKLNWLSEGSGFHCDKSE